MDLTPKTLAAKSLELQETLVKRDNCARSVESLKEDLKTQKGLLASLEQTIRELALEVATGKGAGDQLPLPTEPRSAAERTIPLPLEGNATPPPPPPEESKEALATRNQLSAFVASYRGQRVTFAQIVDAFPGHEAEALRAQLALLVEREEILALPDGWRGRLVEVGEPTEANLQRAVLRALEGGGWLTLWEVVAWCRERSPGLRVREKAVRACLLALEKSGRVEHHEGGPVTGESWRILPETPKAKPSKGKASKPAPKKAPAKGKARGSKAAAAASKAACLAAAVVIEEEPSLPRAAVLRALENATKRRSVRALTTATGLLEDAVECAIEGLLRDGIVVRARRGGYQLKSKAESRPGVPQSKSKNEKAPSKSSKKPAPEAPPPCPPPPAQGHLSLVRKEGLEPPRREASEPKSSQGTQASRILAAAATPPAPRSLSGDRTETAPLASRSDWLRGAA
jgi:biotin operon repressor